MRHVSLGETDPLSESVGQFFRVVNYRELSVDSNRDVAFLEAFGNAVQDVVLSLEQLVSEQVNYLLDQSAVLLA